MVKTIGSVTLFIMFFVGAKYVVQFGANKYNETKATDAVEEMFTEIKNEADTFDPTISKSVALQTVAVKKSEELINSKNTLLEKQQAAFSTFMGFYLVNYRTRAEFCNNLGVDISTYTNEFKSIHSIELELAKELVFTTPDKIEKLYKALKPLAEKTVKQSITDAAKEQNIKPVGICKLIEENGVDVAQDTSVSNILPAVYETIHAKI